MRFLRTYLLLAAVRIHDFLRDNSIFCVSNFQTEAARLTVLRRAQLIFDATTP